MVHLLTLLDTIFDDELNPLTNTAHPVGMELVDDIKGRWPRITVMVFNHETFKLKDS